MTTHYQFFKYYILLSILIIGCNSKNTSKKNDEFALFKTIEVFDSVSRSMKMIPVVERRFSIAANLSLLEKVNLLLDSISNNNFNNLKIETLQINKMKDRGRLLKLNLKENPGFIIPDSLGKYRSWYDFFQGSYGGEQTTIILIESILQKQFIGDWIDEIEFSYQNEPIGEWDHINLSGIIKRK